MTRGQVQGKLLDENSLFLGIVSATICMVMFQTLTAFRMILNRKMDGR